MMSNKSSSVKNKAIQFQSFRMYLTLLLVALQSQLTQSQKQPCYVMKIDTLSTWDTPDYRVDMKINANNKLESVTNVLKPVKIPMWQIIIFRSNNNKINVMFNGTMKVCEFAKYVRRVFYFKPFNNIFFDPKKVNYPLTCPLPAGSYYMKDLSFPPDTPVLSFSYAPNTLYSMLGWVLSRLDNGTSDKLFHYAINATIVKRC